MRVATKLSIWVAVFGVIASSLAAYYSFKASEPRLVKAAEEQLSTASKMLSSRFTILTEQFAKDALVLSSLPSIESLFDSAGKQEENAHLDELNLTLARVLQMHPEYYQLRIIGAKDYGLERVKVERGEKGVLVHTQQQLREKLHFDYVYKTLSLAPEQVYLSKVDISDEAGYRYNLNKPTLRVASPISGQQGENLGVLVIDVDVNYVFQLIWNHLPEDIELFLTNQRGDYLYHPNRGKTFGFERGKRLLVSEDIPELSGFLASTKQQTLLSLASENSTNQAKVLAFQKASLPGAGPNEFVVVGLATSVDALLADANRLSKISLEITLTLSVLGMLAAVVFSRIFSSPLTQMVNTIHNYKPTDSTLGELPTKRNDEIGELAVSFNNMHRQIASQLSLLQESEAHLQHLARHDGLTKLPNRSLFQEKLLKAIEQAAQQHYKVAVMFVDLDHFKQINDSFGHEIGDEVLIRAAQTLKGTVREGDTVSRFGGDEFLIVVDQIFEDHSAIAVANKLVSQLNEPMLVEGRSFKVAASIGISVFPDDGIEPEELVHRADIAMYNSKQSGKGRFSFYSELTDDQEQNLNI